MQLDPDKSIFEYKIEPYWQALTVLGIIIVFCSIAKLAQMAGIFEPKVYFPWVICFSFLLFYALGNCALSFSSDNPSRYWTLSILSYIALVSTGGLIAYMFSGLSIGEAASFKWIFFVFTIGYIILLTIMRSMRLIVRYAQRQDERLRGEE